MTTMIIQMNFPREEYEKVEEYCINNACTIADYFLKLHLDSKVPKEEEKPIPVEKRKKRN